jgi:hypothetical protein
LRTSDAPLCNQIVVNFLVIDFSDVDRVRFEVGNIQEKVADRFVFDIGPPSFQISVGEMAVVFVSWWIN